MRYECYFSNGCNGKRIAAANAKIRSLWNAVKLIFGITKCLCYGSAVCRLLIASNRAIMVLDLLIEMLRLHFVACLRVKGC